MRFARPKALRRAGVLAINRRNAHYTLKYNARRLYPLADDKLRTKRLALEANIAVPELYGLIESEYQVRDLPAVFGDRRDFVIKPAHGSGGDGILVVESRARDLYRLAGGELMTLAEMGHHVFNILGGLFSLGGQPDQAIVEYRVIFDPVFDSVSFQGVPDVRIVVFLGVPVMAMVRLPTRLSGGKANLHKGAVGAGIDMATGRTLGGVWRNESVTEHPDTGESVEGLTIPHWDRLLSLAAGCYEVTGLGYQGVDLVLDKNKGPLLLELNARPGLNIQIANRAGLLPRLELVERVRGSLKSLEERIDLARNRFGSS